MKIKYLVLPALALITLSGCEKMTESEQAVCLSDAKVAYALMEARQEGASMKQISSIVLKEDDVTKNINSMANDLGIETDSKIAKKKAMIKDAFNQRRFLSTQMKERAAQDFREKYEKKCF